MKKLVCPKYKDSGIEWLGQIPAHRQVQKRFTDKQLKNAINWMKENKLVPQGHGPKTSHKTKEK